MAMMLDGFIRKKTNITIGTKEFIFTELNLADLGEFKARLTKQREELNDKRRKRLIEDAQKIGNINPLELLKLTDTSISEEEVENEMYTTEGIGYLAYLSLKYAHPEIELKQVMLIMGFENIDDITKAMFPLTKSDDVQKKIMEKVKSHKQQE